jgi:hypothetical protein
MLLQSGAYGPCSCEKQIYYAFFFFVRAVEVLIQEENINLLFPTYT